MLPGLSSEAAAPPPDELVAWVALALAPHVGGKTAGALVAAFGSAAAVLGQPMHALQTVRGVGPTIARGIVTVDAARAAWRLAHWQAAGVQVLPLPHPAFPAALAALPDPPAVLYVRGAWPLPPARAVAVVGTRAPSARAQSLALVWGAQLAAHGARVVSGLALGVDTLAHEAALVAPGAGHVAVLGGGVLNVYPPQNRPLAVQLLAQGGALLSETAPDESPSAARLVARNRLIVGLAGATVVLETSTEGGAMHAARRAATLGRALYTPDLAASGNQHLLQTGLARLLPHGPAALLADVVVV